jgi:hypothetical protein
MKKLVYIITMLVFLLSCDNKQKTNPCLDIEKRYDSVVDLQAEYENSIVYKFYKILIKEKGTASDSILIKDYKSLEGKDSLINLYIWDRVHTINQNITKLNVYEEFKGTYLLKPNHNKKYAQATKIKIDKDSCYIYKYNNLIVSDKFKLINSSNKYIKGKIRIKNPKLFLDRAVKSKLLISLDDNGCMDCEQLQFYKTN